MDGKTLAEQAPHETDESRDGNPLLGLLVVFALWIPLVTAGAVMWLMRSPA